MTRYLHVALGLAFIVVAVVLSFAASTLGFAVGTAIRNLLIGAC
jgi:hypothetical protein